MTNIPITGMAVVYGGVDLSDEFFDRHTQFDLDLKRGEFPLYFDHGFNPILGKQRVGRGTLHFEPNGVRFDGVIEVSPALAVSFKSWIAAGMLGLSTGVPGHLADRDQQAGGRNRITRWPIGEVSVTPSPAEPSTRVSLKHDIEAIKARVAEGMKEISRREEYERAWLNHCRLKHMLQAHELGIKIK